MEYLVRKMVGFHGQVVDFKQLIRKRAGLSGRIKEILQRKRWSQADFAKAAGKKEAEISKWMSGTHNFTIRTISFIETVLGEDVISIKRYHRHVSGYGTANADRTAILNDGGNQAEYNSVD